MTSNEPIIGTMSLSPEAEGVPDDGLSVSSLRVELSAAGHSSPVWIAELLIRGDLPWRKGEERQVEVRIMSDEFREYVTTERPALVVWRGPETIGNVLFD